MSQKTRTTFSSLSTKSRAKRENEGPVFPFTTETPYSKARLRLGFGCKQYTAMIPGLVLFKARQISWNKEQKQGFFQQKKNN